MFQLLPPAGAQLLILYPRLQRFPTQGVCIVEAKDSTPDFYWHQDGYLAHITPDETEDPMCYISTSALFKRIRQLKQDGHNIVPALWSSNEPFRPLEKYIHMMHQLPGCPRH